MSSDLGLALTAEEVEALVELHPADDLGNVDFAAFVRDAAGQIKTIYEHKTPHLASLRLNYGRYV